MFNLYIMTDYKRKISGIFTIILYICVIIYPYISSYKQGYLGFNSKNTKKYNLISTAFRRTDKPLEVVFITLFLISSIWFYYEMGFLNYTSNIFMVPVLTILMALFMILILWLHTEYIQIHNVIGLLIVLFGLCIIIVTYKKYSENFKSSQIKDLSNLELFYVIVSLITFLVGFLNLYNNYIRTEKVFRSSVLVDIVGVLEFILFLSITIYLSILITYPKIE